MILAKGQKISETKKAIQIAFETNQLVLMSSKKRTKYLPNSAPASYCKIRQLFRSFFGGYEKKLIWFRDFLTFSLKFIFKQEFQPGPCRIETLFIHYGFIRGIH